MTIDNNFWIDYNISESDLDFIYNFLLETQIPANSKQLSQKIIEKITDEESIRQKNDRLSGGMIFKPSEKYSLGQSLVFPENNWKKGTVVNIRDGRNPDYVDLQVIDVKFSESENKSFGSNIQNHHLNDIDYDQHDETKVNEYFDKYGQIFSKKFEEILAYNEDLVCIAGSYFPRSLLVDVSIGHLNLCEAVLEMENGGPLTTQELIKQIELPTDVNANLTEFSLNLALQEDPRFDEVGPAGKTLWFLNRLEPDEVRTEPLPLRYSNESILIPDELAQYRSLGADICDELDDDCSDDQEIDEVTLCLTYPHWRAGTLPLTKKLKKLFPTAYETPRVKFDFIDGNSQVPFSGWVVRPSKYIFGLRDWYVKSGFIPGSLIHVSKGNIPGQVIIRADKQKNMKEWIRTVLVGADGGIVFALLKQVVTCTFDERLALVIPDVEAIDKLWDSKSRQPIEKTIQNTMKELSKLNPQGNIHAQEIYAAVNLIRRCPPSVILNVLFNQPWSNHLGDLYFRLEDN